jgi:hypothetical protein
MIIIIMKNSKFRPIEIESFLPSEVIEALDTQELLLVRRGNKGTPDTENSGTGCHCSPKNYSTGCHC